MKNLLIATIAAISLAACALPASAVTIGASSGSTSTTFQGVQVSHEVDTSKTNGTIKTIAVSGSACSNGCSGGSGSAGLTISTTNFNTSSKLITNTAGALFQVTNTCDTSIYSKP